MAKKKIGVFSFFTGAGFLDLGFEKAGMDILYVNEIYKPFIDGYNHSRKSMNLPMPKFGVFEEDIESVTSDKGRAKLSEMVSAARESHQLIGFIGGPPCPDFSVGGKNRGREGENGKLSATYIRAIVQQQPDFFLFENVKGLWRTKIHRAFFEELKKRIVKAGYLTTEKLINSIEYGAPQDRDRIILVGIKKSLLPDSVHDGKVIIFEKFGWEKQILGNSEDLFGKNWPTQDKYSENGNRKMPVGLPKELTIEHWFEKNNVTKHPNQEHRFTPRQALSKFKVISEGDDTKKSFKRLHRWRYSPTACYGNNEVHIHPYEARRISVAEALAIQSLPKEYELPSSMTLTDMFKTIGNGVPFLAANGLAKTISDFILKYA